MDFTEIGLSPELLQAVYDAGYTNPTPIQQKAIPVVATGRDILGCAQTGTGKTASFALPMIDKLAAGRARARMPRSLILEPTRELAQQVAENFDKYGKNHDLKMALLIGGVQMGDQVKALQEGVDVLIATPGRLMDLFERGKILLTGCNLLVIDEADRMLDMGFIPDIETICTKLPKNRQTLLFSATMPPPIKKLADKFLSNPKQIEVARPASANINIVQKLVEVSSRGKKKMLEDMLRAEAVTNAIVFSNRKTTVRELAQSLKRDGFNAGEIHGDMEQAERIRELDRFKTGDITILVASDVAARGLDVKGVSHVFNYDVPWHPDDYIHRIGRTGRAGATGTAYTLATPDDAEAIANIEKLTGMPIPRLAATAIVAPAAAETEKPARPARERRPAKSEPKREAPAKAAAPKAEAPALAPAPAVAPRADRQPPRRDPPRSERTPAERTPAERAPAERVPERVNARDDGPDEGWNGPVPSFLGFKFDL